MADWNVILDVKLEMELGNHLGWRGQGGELVFCACDYFSESGVLQFQGNGVVGDDIIQMFEKELLKCRLKLVRECRIVGDDFWGCGWLEVLWYCFE